MSSTIFTHPDDTIANRHEQLRQAARKRWPEWAAGDLDNRSGYLIDKGSGLLFRPVPHVVFARGVEVAPGADIAGFYNSGSALHFFERTTNPGTVAELEAQEAARARQEREQAHADFIATQPLRTVTLAELEGDPTSVPTLRQAVCQLYGLGGRLEADGPDLLVRVPSRLAEDPNADHTARQTLPRIVRVIRAGRNTILSELAKDSKTPLADRFPDRHVGAAGGLA